MCWFLRTVFYVLKRRRIKKGMMTSESMYMLSTIMRCAMIPIETEPFAWGTGVPYPQGTSIIATGDSSKD